MLDHLFSPFKIRNLELENRAVMPPMGTGLGNPDGTVNDANLAYLKRQAESGAGLIITEITAVHPTGSVGHGHLGNYDDRFLPGLEKMAATIHKAGGKAALQLHHAGRENMRLLAEGKALGPSPIPSKIYRVAPLEMSTADIEEIVEAFGTAAVRAKQAGFDTIELHGAHGYLLTQFLSGLSNQREDGYGGSLQNRARFVLEVLRSVREKVGDDFPILLRISAEEFIKNGYVVDDIKQLVPDFMTAGADAIHASIGTHGSPGGVTSAPAEYEPGWNVWRAKAIRDYADVPVIAVGRFTDPAAADDFIARGEADLIAFGRQQLADPDYLIKAREGRSKDIRLCLACNQGCIERLMFESKSVRCAINPEIGQELIYPKGPAKNSRDVWVIGAGPAGLTAACEAARLGHNVTLFDKNAAVGGQIHFASQAPFKSIYWDWIEWLAGQVDRSGAAVKTGVSVTEEMISDAKPDFVILATGGKKILPAIAGSDLPNVCSAWDILGKTTPPGKNVVVVGGGLIGMETADYLIDKGSKVTLVEQLPQSPVAKQFSHGYMLHRRLREGECPLIFGAQVTRIEKASVAMRIGGKEEALSPVDQVVMAVGMTPVDDLKEYLAQAGIPHAIVGDTAEVRRIMEATEEGAKAAWDIP